MPPRKGKEVPCDYCGKIIYVPKWKLESHKHHYCSAECRTEHQRDPAIHAHRPKTGKEVPCEYCGKLVYRARWELETGHRTFCSVECAGKFRSDHPEIYLPPSTLIEKQCKQCGKTFKHIPAVDRQFCSMECWREWKHNHLGIDDPRSTRIKTTCDWCGEEMNCIPARFNSHEYHFCSRDCQQEWFQKSYSKSEEFSQKMKEAYAASANSPNRSNIVRDTIPQRIVNEWLNEMNYAYTNEELFNSFQVDNYLVDYNLAIEVMGDYWHFNPLVFPDVKQGDPLKRIERDQIKRRVLLVEHGISTLYLWESDIKKREEVCKTLIQMFVENKGHLENYNSFNYVYESGILKVKEPVVAAFFEYPMQEIVQIIA